MSEIIIETDDGDLFGEKIIASFACDVEYEYIPYEKQTEYSPEEGGYTDIHGYTFKMYLHDSDGKNDLLNSFIRYDDLCEEKRKEINIWVNKWLEDYFKREEDCDNTYDRCDLD